MSDAAVVIGALSVNIQPFNNVLGISHVCVHALPLSISLSVCLPLSSVHVCVYVWQNPPHSPGCKAEALPLS